MAMIISGVTKGLSLGDKLR